MTVQTPQLSEASLIALRYGYGLSQRPIPRDVAQMLGRLGREDEMARRYRVMPFDEVRALARRHNETRRVRTEGEAQEKAYQAVRRDIRMAEEAHLMRAFARITDTDDPFRERLAWFWADHFTARARSFNLAAGGAAYIDEAIRPHVAGRFGEMLKAVVTHPLMILYLDQVVSFGPNSPRAQREGRGLNENLARELLELHTLGVGGPYTQADVRQLAELLTGLTFSLKEGARFAPPIAEPGAETVLGVSYGGAGQARIEDIHAVLEDLAVHPATAAHVCGKLAAHFTADVPDPEMVRQMVAAYRASGGDLMAVYHAMLGHRAAWAPGQGKVKQPFDFMASALVALRVPGRELVRMDSKAVRRLIRYPLARMGQPFLAPPGPDGWPDTAEDWITPQGVAERVTWAMRAPTRLVPALPDPRRFVLTALGEAATPRTVFAAGAAETVAEGIGLVLAAPEFQRR